MRRLIIISGAVIAISAAAIFLRLHSHETEGNHLTTTVADKSNYHASGVAPSDKVVGGTIRPAGNDTASIPKREGLRANLERLQNCGTAQALLAAQDIKIRGGCARDKDVQNCIAQGYAANERIPYLAKLKKDLSLCGDSQNLPRDIYLASRAAAEAGDVDAQLCFAVGFGRQEEDGGLSGIGDYDADYRSLAERYIDAAFARGDWRIVQRFAQDHVFMGDVSLASVYPYGTPEVAYKMNRLLQMGAIGQYADQVGTTLKLLLSPDAQGHDQLTRKQIQDGDQWAEVMYAAHFSQSPKLTKEPGDLCEQP